MPKTQEDYDLEAIRIAREIQKTLFRKNNIPETISSLDQIICLPIQKEAGKYSLVDYIEDLEDVGEVVIDNPRLSKGKQHPEISAMYENFNLDEGGHKVLVTLLRSLNYCESRFYIAKELLHYCLDRGDENTISTTERFGIVMKELIEDDLMPSEEATSAERAAFSGAVELLIPNSWMPQILKAYDIASRYHSWEPETVSYRIAHFLRVQARLLNARAMQAFVTARAGI